MQKLIFLFFGENNMERKIALSEEEMLINKGIDMEKQQHSPSDKKIYSKWYDSWYYLNCIYFVVEF